MKRNLIDLFREKQMVEDERLTLLNFVAPFGKFTCHIGGSYIMKLWISECLTKESHDYDFIIRGENLAKLRVHLESLVRLGIISRGSSDPNGSYRIGTLLGRPVDVLLDDKYSSPKASAYESLRTILQVKKDWIERALKNSKQPRQKDLDDVSIIEKHLKEGELPF